MEITQKTNAIVLNREPYNNENDSRVFVYTSDFGKLDLMARGTQKLSSKLAGHIEPLNFCEIMIIKGKQYDYLGNAIAKQVFRQIKSDWCKVNTVGWAVKVFNELIKEKQQDEKIFNLLWSLLYIINSGNAKSDQLLASLFIVQLLSVLGHKPEVYSCVQCRQKLKPENNKFNFNKGGVICKNCQNSSVDEMEINTDVIKVLRLGLEKDLKFLAKISLNDEYILEVENLVKGFVEYRN